MPRPVAEIDPPWQGRKRAIRVIRQSREKAPDAADRDPDAERDDEQIAGRARYAKLLLCDLHADPSAEQTADDRLAAEQRERAGAVEVFVRRLQPREHLAARQCAEDA